MSNAPQDQQSSHSLWQLIKLYSCGFLIGSADIVPGVSGGTMAFITGIYNDLVANLNRFIQFGLSVAMFKFDAPSIKSKLPWSFMLSLGLGIISAVLLLSTPIHWLLENKLAYILSFFFGLIIASILFIVKKITQPSIRHVIAFVPAAIIGWIIVGLPLLQSPPTSPLYLIFCGALAICAMILPGISGSFILLLLGKYETIISTIKNLKSGIEPLSQIITLSYFAVGAGLGLTLFIKLLNFLLQRCYDITLAILVGFMCGSLRKIWPWKIGNSITGENMLPQELNQSVIICFVLALLGIGIVFLVEYIAAKTTHEQTAS